jgi:hypothetical protein
MRILICTTCLLSMIAFPRAPFAQQAGVVTAPPVHESSKSYTGPIFDVHLHTDPPVSAIGVPNPVTGMAAALRATKFWRQLGTLSRWLICRNDMEIRSSPSQWM